MGIVEYPLQDDMDDLLEKQVQARMYFCKCPLRRAHNMKWRARWNAQLKWPQLSVIK
jgi:hypothetical protein